MEKLLVIRSLELFKSLYNDIKKAEYIAFDTETTGLDKNAEIIGFSICSDLTEAFYVVLSEWDVKEQKLVRLPTYEYAKEFLSSLTHKKLIMHNSVFDCWKVETNFNVQLMPSVHTDTMILAHIVDENRRVGLKELASTIFGDNSRDEQVEMKKSIVANEGKITRSEYELYKADSHLIGKYGAKDALLTLKLFYHLTSELLDQKLDAFFYDDESMPLLRGPTYDMNTSGLLVNMDKLQKLKGELEVECMEAKAYIHHEIDSYVKDKYPGTKASNTFNIGASKQLSWLLFERLGNEFLTLTQSGKDLCYALGIKIPYTAPAKREFISMCKSQLGVVFENGKYNPKTGKTNRPKKIVEPWNYIACGKSSITKYSIKYKWAAKLLEYAKNLKLLNTYVIGIQTRIQYGTIRPSFLQHGTTSGRYSSKSPNFQNLPRTDKRVKDCIVSRPGYVFVGADYSQLEPRVFASYSNDKRLLECFKSGDDFYSVIGVEIFNKVGLSLRKDDKESFAKVCPELRDVAKAVALSATYGTTAFKMAPLIKKNTDEAQQVIDDYFDKFPSVKQFMENRHSDVQTEGVVYNLFGRPRRLPDAQKIEQLYGSTIHSDLPYNARNILNLSVNHTIQSTAASIMNRAAINCYEMCKRSSFIDERWKKVKIVLQVHDELILEGPEELEQEMCQILKESMENTVQLPGVDLVAEPKIGKTLAELK